MGPKRQNCRHYRWSPGSAGSMAGQSMVELLVILVAMLALIFGTIQFALIYNAKTTLNYAAFEAVRAGTLNNASYEAVKEGFARGLAPLYSYADEDGSQVGAFKRARRKIFSEFDSSEQLIRIERLNPRPSDFDDFALESGFIPNDNLRFRSSLPGTEGLQSIQDANILHIRVTYWYPLYVPVANSAIYSVIRRITRWRNHPACRGDTKRIPLTAVAAMRMQSPAENSEGYFQEETE